MKEPVDHVARAALPWRAAEDALTECGRRAAEVKADVISLDALQARIKDLGKTRTAMTMCMTCYERADSHRLTVWAQDPASVLSRELQRCGLYLVPWHKPSEDQERMRRELHAMAALIEAHREEFDDYVSGLAQTISLDELRVARHQRHVAGIKPGPNGWPIG